jgi:hypothetical protein
MSDHSHLLKWLIKTKAKEYGKSWGLAEVEWRGAPVLPEDPEQPKEWKLNSPEKEPQSPEGKGK